MASQNATLKVPRLGPVLPGGDSYAQLLETMPAYQLSNQSWPAYQTACSASFRIAHADSAILLRFDVKNDYFKSKQRTVNGAVSRDNCVEFFVAFGGGGYYNIEYNCLGVAKIAYGSRRENRQFLSVDTIRQVGVFTCIDQSGENFHWQIVLIIPVTVFEFHRISSLKGVSCSGNFYKCGDELPQPHFLCWNSIRSPEPDFHLPEYFGDIIFQ